MNEIFLTVLNMSLRASYVILFVIIVRFLLRKAPKVISYALWGVVAFRLIIPYSFESIFSLMPRNANVAQIPADIVYRQSTQTYSEIETAASYVSRSIPASAVSTSANPLQLILKIVMKTGPYIWLTGIMGLLAYSLISVWRLKRQLTGARLTENNIYEADNLKTPFVFGLLRPKIYLPVGLDGEERRFILLHEQTHLHRKDNVIKVLAFLIAVVHWFNPLVWTAFMLMGTDMELSCDERVLKIMKEDIKKSYASSLLSLATGKHILNGSPLAFGEGDVKRRIKNVLNYKKPGLWIMFLSIITAAAIVIGLAVNPKSYQKLNGSSYRVKEILYDAPIYSFTYTMDTVPKYSISSDYQLYSKESTDEDWFKLGKLERYEISKQELKALFSPSSNENYMKSINKTKLVYRTDIPDNETFYLVIQLKDGNVLLAIGYDFKDNRHVRWLFSLERQSDFDDTALITNGILWDAVGDVPQPVRDYAMDYVSGQIEYYNSLGCNITEAKITAMTSMSTGTASETMSIELWLLEYRLKPENADKVVLADGMQMEDGWLTERSSMGQPYLLLECQYTKDMEEIWQRICVTYTDEIEQNYATPEMLDKYGNKFTAAAMELYEINKYNLKDNNSSQREESSRREKIPPLVIPHLTQDMSVGVEVIPDYIDDKRLIFHGYFGLFVYDLSAEEITLAVDIEKAVGTTQIQGSEGAAVRVNKDGTLIQLYYYSEQGDPEMAYYIDPSAGDCSYDKYSPISDAFSLPADFNGRFTGATLGELTFTDGEKSWLIFKDKDWILGKIRFVLGKIRVSIVS